MLPDLAIWADDPHAGCLAHAVRARKIPCGRILAGQGPEQRPLTWLHFAIGDRSYYYRQAYLVATRNPADSRAAYPVNGETARFTFDKQATKRLLSELGVSVPRGQVFAASDVAGAQAMFASMGRPACVKPTFGQQGRAVYPRLLDRQAFAAAFELAGRSFDQLVVEEHLEGEAVRFFYVRPSVVGVRLDRPAHVIGDGRRSIDELVAAKNRERWYRALPGIFPIALDAEAQRYLALQGLELASVPVAGRRVLLRGTSNIPTGGDPIDCRGILHPSYSRLVEEFCRRISALRLTAVDMVIQDLAAPAAPGYHWALELNGAPGLTPFYFPWEGEPQDVGGALIDRLLAEPW
jgi:D-alanine-D-alanine ligase-like ATP-grasp enzyme